MSREKRPRKRSSMMAGRSFVEGRDRSVCRSGTAWRRGTGGSRARIRRGKPVQYTRPSRTRRRGRRAGPATAGARPRIARSDQTWPIGRDRRSWEPVMIAGGDRGARWRTFQGKLRPPLIALSDRGRIVEPATPPNSTALVLAAAGQFRALRRVRGTYRSPCSAPLNIGGTEGSPAHVGPTTPDAGRCHRAARRLPTAHGRRGSLSPRRRGRSPAGRRRRRGRGARPMRRGRSRGDRAERCRAAGRRPTPPP